MLDLFWPTVAMAQEAPAGPAGDASQRFFAQLMLILSFVLIMYFLFLRPQMKRQKQVQQMLGGLKNGDRVLTTGGLYGQVLGIKDDVVVLKIAEDVKVEVAKSAIAGVVTR